MRVKKIALIFFCALALLFLVMAGWVAWSYAGISQAGPLENTKIVLIERGKGISSIAQKLEDEGVISSSLVFKIRTVLDSDKRPLKAGEYEFTQKISMKDAMELLRAGKVYDRKITFPEGVTSYQIVESLKLKTDLTGDVSDIPEDGTLLPETYHYINNDNRATILAAMTAAMDKVVLELWPSRVADLPFTTQKQALTLASIVEKETGIVSERARIAGVFINRLKRGIPLQSDPTVIYAMTKGQIENEGQGPIGRRLLSKDLSIESPYNTYLNAGLPPTPIANPGRAAIEAVLHPEVHDYIYFVADGTGGHVFARTLAEHNSNVARWRKIRKSQ